MQKNQIDIIAVILGNIGKLLVLIGMACGCFLVWYLIITNIIR
jgi:hypothetical protein